MFISYRRCIDQRSHGAVEGEPEWHRARFDCTGWLIRQTEEDLKFAERLEEEKPWLVSLFRNGDAENTWRQKMGVARKNLSLAKYHLHELGDPQAALTHVKKALRSSIEGYEATKETNEGVRGKKTRVSKAGVGGGGFMLGWAGCASGVARAVNLDSGTVDQKDGGSSKFKIDAEEDAGEKPRLLEAAPSLLDFGAQAFGLRRSLTLTLSNSGSERVSIHSARIEEVTIDGESRREFSTNPPLDQLDDLTLESFEQRKIEIVYEPADNEEDEGALVLEGRTEEGATSQAVEVELESSLEGTPVLDLCVAPREWVGSPPPDNCDKPIIGFFALMFNDNTAVQEVRQVFVKNRGLENNPLELRRIDLVRRTPWADFLDIAIEDHEGNILNPDNEDHWPYFLGPATAVFPTPYLQVHVAFIPGIAGDFPEDDQLTAVQEGEALLIETDAFQWEVPIRGEVLCTPSDPYECRGSDCDCCWNYEASPDEEDYYDSSGRPCTPE